MSATPSTRRIMCGSSTGEVTQGTLAPFEVIDKPFTGNQLLTRVQRAIGGQEWSQHRAVGRSPPLWDELPEPWPFTASVAVAYGSWAKRMTACVPQL